MITPHMFTNVSVFVRCRLYPYNIVNSHLAFVRRDLVITRKFGGANQSIHLIYILLLITFNVSVELVFERVAC